jgi:hypothetical protein
MKYIELTEIFEAVEKAVQMHAMPLVCLDCGKRFYKINMVDEDEPDYIAVDPDVHCNDHVLYDLLVNQFKSEKILAQNVVTKNNKPQIQAKWIDAKIFLPNRTN